MYEDYMQSGLGMQMNTNQDTYERQMYGYMPYGNWQENTQPMWSGQMPYNMPQNLAQVQYGIGPMEAMQTNVIIDLESMYPDIYNIVYPMVKKACVKNTKPITKELIDEMTDEIYSNIEADNIINLNINVENVGNSVTTESRQQSGKQMEDRKVENRQRRNTIADLIKILLIRELVDRGNWRPRPPRPGRPGRPPRPCDWDDNCPPRPPMPRY